MIKIFVFIVLLFFTSCNVDEENTYPCPDGNCDANSGANCAIFHDIIFFP